MNGDYVTQLIENAISSVPLKPTLTAQNGDVDLNTGANTVLTCTSVGADEFQFYHGATSLGVFTGTDTVTISNFQLANQGGYSCKGKNGAGESTLSDALTLTLGEFYCLFGYFLIILTRFVQPYIWSHQAKPMAWVYCT